MFPRLERRRWETLADMTGCLYLMFNHLPHPPAPHPVCHPNHLLPSRHFWNHGTEHNWTICVTDITTRTVISLCLLQYVYMLGLSCQTQQCLADSVVAMVTIIRLEIVVSPSIGSVM